MMFKIGDVARYTEIGEDVEILDVLEGNSTTVYLAKATGGDTMYYLDDDDLEEVSAEKFEHEISVNDTTAVVAIYSVVGDKRKLIARGHSHILHDGAVGYAQAIGYACNRIVKNLGGNTDVRGTDGGKRF